jgi:hypothetical protein
MPEQYYRAVQQVIEESEDTTCTLNHFSGSSRLNHYHRHAVGPIILQLPPGLLSGLPDALGH